MSLPLRRQRENSPASNDVEERAQEWDFYSARLDTSKVQKHDPKIDPTNVDPINKHLVAKLKWVSHSVLLTTGLVTTLEFSVTTENLLTKNFSTGNHMRSLLSGISTDLDSNSLLAKFTDIDLKTDSSNCSFSLQKNTYFFNPNFYFFRFSGKI
jgi:hypothetical protein